MKAATMVVFPQTKSNSEVAGTSVRPGDLVSNDSGPAICAERKELMAWNSVSKRIAAVFVEAAEEEAKVEELKAGGVARSRGCSGEMDASCMCSPAPSSVFPTDVSTSAG